VADELAISLPTHLEVCVGTEVNRTQDALAAILSADTQVAAGLYSAALEGYRRALALESSLADEVQVELRLKAAMCFDALSQYENVRETLEPLLTRPSW
jgi:hypothetical protein